MRNFHGACIHYTNFHWGVCLGKHIFIGHTASAFVLHHEFGHYMQWCKLGPAFYLLVGIPSLLHAALWVICGKRWKYYDFPVEREANRLASEFFNVEMSR